MSRITKIEGEFMGVKFEVKPTPIRLDKIEEKSRNMLRDWYKKNHPETFKKLDNPELDLDDYSQEDLKNLGSWMNDVEFRAEYLKFRAEAAMDFSKEIPMDVWESDDLQVSTIEEAWDFFTNKRQVPINGVRQL